MFSKASDQTDINLRWKLSDVVGVFLRRLGLAGAILIAWVNPLQATPTAGVQGQGDNAETSGNED